MKYIGIFKEVAKIFRRGDNIIILEIGVNISARSTGAFLQGLEERKKSGLLYSIDIVDYKKIVDKKYDYLTKRWIFIEGDSKKIDWNRKVDVLFIDGDHSYSGVKADYEKYEPFVKNGGLILMHDVTTPKKSFGVKKLYNEIKYPKIILNFDSLGLGIITKK